MNSMTSEQAIQLAVDRIVEAAQPNRVILFGSHARGDATRNSDIDLMVIEEEVMSKQAEMVRLRHAVGNVGAGVDVLVYSEEEAAHRGQVPGTVIYWAIREGQVLYDAST